MVHRRGLFERKSICKYLMNTEVQLTSENIGDTNRIGIKFKYFNRGILKLLWYKLFLLLCTNYLVNKIKSLPFNCTIIANIIHWLTFPFPPSHATQLPPTNHPRRDECLYICTFWQIVRCGVTQTQSQLTHKWSTEPHTYSPRKACALWRQRDNKSDVNDDELQCRAALGTTSAQCAW